MVSQPGRGSFDSVNNHQQTMPYFSFERQVTKVVTEAGYINRESEEEARQDVEAGEGTVEDTQEIEALSIDEVRFYE